MKVVGFCGYSGAGKTTLAEQLVAFLTRAGLRVSVVKHAHHDFDIDHPGKDSWRHRQAGAYEVVIASDRRMAKMREYPRLEEPTVDALLGELVDCDWALVEGFKHAALPKIEVWRAATGKPALYPADDHVIAVATDDVAALPASTALPLFELGEIERIAAFLQGRGDRHEYRPGRFRVGVGVD
ncbi:MAG TPA: molybdopterin-guanine dinucleotide biosynthesis protein B [Caldimonas sp.]|nr:molybdopterin-guanine dinucleotide biosynthesis protein B [Caldimonas sp.]